MSSLVLLRQGSFRLVLAAHLTSLIGDRAAPVALAFAVLGLTGSATDLGLVLAAYTVPMVISLLIGGALADRISRLGIMISADLTRLVGQGLLGALLISGHAVLWHLVVIQAVVGAASGFFNPAASGLIPMVVRAEQLQQANALENIARSIGGICGPLIGGVLVAAAGPGEAILVDAATFAVSAGLLMRVRVPSAAERRVASDGSFLGDLRGGWTELTSRAWLWSMTVAAALTNMFTAAAFVILGALVAEQELGGAGAWGAILAARAAGQLCGGLALLRVRPQRPLLVAALASQAGAIPLVLLALGAPAASIALAASLEGVSVVLWNALFMTTVQRQVPIGALSRVAAYDWIGSFAFQPIGLALMGPTANAFGVAATLYLVSAIHLAAVVAVLFVRDVRTMRAPSLVG